MLPAIVVLGKPPVFVHLFCMLDVSRERGVPPERIFSTRDVRAFAIEIHLRPTPENLLALMLAIGTRRFVRPQGS